MAPTDEVKAKVDIVDLISETVSLKRAGRNFSSPCPFHDERTPSFFVSPDRQTWHCFGACATGGDIFSFVMRRDGIGFGDALRLLAERSGITLPRAEAARERASRDDRLKAVNRAAAMYFHDALAGASEAKAAREYLERRELTSDTVEDFRLGFCPKNREALQRHLTNEGFSQQELVAAGLLRQRDDGSLYSLFQGRLIIPIMDERSDYIGFGARALGDETPKYVNSPQSPVFEKASVLYAIHRARDVIRQEQQAVIVEGYMDVLTAHQHGYRNVVASMGTALTERQVGSLTKLASRFVLALDPDAAGDAATLRSLDDSWRILKRPRGSDATDRLSPDVRLKAELRIMELPPGKDPDELIKGSPQEWEALIASATPFIDYVFRAVVTRLDATTPEGKESAVKRLAPLILNEANIFEQNERIRKLAELLKEDENVIRRAVGSAKPARSGRPGARAKKGGGASSFQESPRESLEQYCLATLLRFPELADVARLLSPQHFLEEANREIFSRLSDGVATEALKDGLDESVHADLDALLDYQLQPAKYGDRVQGLEKCVAGLERRLVDLEAELLLVQLETGDVPIEELSARQEELNVRRRKADERVARRPASV
jgi:DNA primase